MKREDEYIRKLLLDLEGSEDCVLLSALTLDRDDEEEKQYYHIQLLCDAGLMIEVQHGLYRMTNQGHDFIATIRSDNIWNKTKVGASQLGGVTLGILKDIALAYVKQEAKKSLGIDLP